MNSSLFVLLFIFVFSHIWCLICLRSTLSIAETEIESNLLHVTIDLSLSILEWCVNKKKQTVIIIRIYPAYDCFLISAWDIVFVFGPHSLISYIDRYREQFTHVTIDLSRSICVNKHNEEAVSRPERGPPLFSPWVGEERGRGGYLAPPLSLLCFFLCIFFSLSRFLKAS
jgi:hypothetical protein